MFVLLFAHYMSMVMVPVNGSHYCKIVVGQEVFLLLSLLTPLAISEWPEG